MITPPLSMMEEVCLLDYYPLLALLPSLPLWHQIT